MPREINFIVLSLIQNELSVILLLFLWQRLVTLTQCSCAGAYVTIFSVGYNKSGDSLELRQVLVDSCAYRVCLLCLFLQTFSNM